MSINHPAVAPSTRLGENLITAIAVVFALVIAVLPPLAYYSRGEASDRAALRIQAQLISGQTSMLIQRSPDGWQLQELRLRMLLIPDGVDLGAPEIRRVVDAAGGELATALVGNLGNLSWPRIAERAPIHDQTAVVAHVLIERSMTELFGGTMRLFLVCIVLAGAVYAFLRVMPMRLMHQAVARAAWLAAHDPLTGLANRAVLGEKLSDALARAARRKTDVAVLCLDLDNFKDVNDTLGHAAGDRLLNEVVRRLKENIRATDTLARLGGDEFAILQSDAAQPHFAQSLAARLVELLAQPFDLDGSQVVIGVSIGIAVAHEGAGRPDQMLQHGDMALYSAKAAGRGAFRFFEQEMNDTLAHRKALEADLRQAMAEGQFRLHFQPQMAMGAGTAAPVIQGAEALIRWTSPTRGEMAPDVFIPLAEETGLIVPIGAWVLREACTVALGWTRPLSVAVNVSTVQFRRPGFVAMVEEVLAETGLPASRLELEITESVMMEDEGAAMAVMDSLRALGVRVAMDDFGTGYSSLGYLRKFRFDKIKIDRSFIQGLGKSGEAEAIVRAVVGISQALGIRANAEGVETAEQAALLSIEGCSEGQGYLFGKPMSGADFAEMLARTDAGTVREAARRATVPAGAQ